MPKAIPKKIKSPEIRLRQTRKEATMIKVARELVDKYEALDNDYEKLMKYKLILYRLKGFSEYEGECFIAELNSDEPLKAKIVKAVSIFLISKDVQFKQPHWIPYKEAYEIAVATGKLGAI